MLPTPIEPEVRFAWSDETSLSEQEVHDLLKVFGDLLPQPLSHRTNLAEYAAKLVRLAEIAVIKVDGIPAGLLVMYANDLTKKIAHIPLLAVGPLWRGRGFGKVMMSRALARARCKGMAAVDLEVDAANVAAVGLYRRFAFSPVESPGSKLRMQASLPQAVLEPAETPVEQMERVSRSFGLGVDLRIKRDDLYPAPGGGIKARKALSIFRELVAREVDVVVTNGGPQSNHARACAVLAAQLGLGCHLVIVLDPSRQYLDTGNILLMRMAGAVIEFCRKEELSERMDRAVAGYRAQGCTPAYVWGGGHCLAGTVAFVDAAREAQQQCGGWIPDYLVLASGTGSTQAGLVAGYLGLPTRVIGVSVARDAARGGRIVAECVEEFLERQTHHRQLYAVDFREAWTSGGYESTSPALLEVIAQAARLGLFLDPTYSGKGFHCLVDLCRSGEIPAGSRVLFWHTGGLMNFMASEFAGGSVSA